MPSCGHPRIIVCASERICTQK
ncbi:unnamed protein product, partial [Rotaria sp. Silwood1]